MAGNRSLFRDVAIWDLNDNKDRIPLGGSILTAGITNTNFHHMLDILPITSDGDEVLRDNHPLPPGDYIIVADHVGLG